VALTFDLSTLQANKLAIFRWSTLYSKPAGSCDQRL